MCRLFALISDHPCSTELPTFMRAFRSLADHHPDGWGFGWYFTGAPAVVKRPVNAKKDQAFVHTCQGIDSNIVLVHLRRRSVGDRTPDNTHPFQYGDFLFMHHGSIKAIDELRNKLPTDYRHRLQGDTDSELLFQWILYNMVKETSVIDGIRAGVETIKREMWSSVSSLDFVLSDSESLYVYRSSRIRHENFELHRLERPRSRSRVGRTLVICSNRLTDEDWVTMENDQLLVVDREMRIISHDI